MNIKNIITGSLVALLLVVSTQVVAPRQTEAQFFMDFSSIQLDGLAGLDFSWLDGWTFTPPPPPPIIDKMMVRKECPIIGQTTGPDGGIRPGGDRKYCETATINMCNYKNIDNGTTFYVYADSANKQGTASDWVMQNNWLDVKFQFTKGTAATRTLTPGGKKRNVMNVIYDGNCGVKVTSQYQGKDSNYKRAYATLSSFGFERVTGPSSEVTVTAVPNRIVLGGILDNNLTLITWNAPTSQVCVSDDFDTGGATSGSKLVPVSATKDIKIVCSNMAPDTIVEDQTEINLAGPPIGRTGLEGAAPTGGTGGGTGGGTIDFKGSTFNIGVFAPQSAHAQATEAHGYRPGGDRKYVESPKVDICKIKPDLQTGETFYIYGDSALNGTRSSWSNANYYLDIKFEFTKGAGGVREYVQGGDKRNHFKAYYDGNCMTYFSSQYQGDSSNFKDAYATYSKVGFNRTVAGNVDPATAKNGQATVTVENAAVPTIAFSANPTTIVSGQSTTLTWDSENATTCSGTNFSTGGATDGSVAVPITMPAGGTQNFSIMCSGPAGNSTQNVNVNVTPAPLTAITVDLRAIPSAISDGDDTRLEWSSTNATTCTGTGFDTEGLTAGSKTVVPADTTTYRVTCTAGANSAFDDATVTVADVPEEPVYENCLFNGNTVTHGSSVTAWQALSVEEPATCVSESRTCTNGSLSGSYQFASCTVGPPVPPLNPGDCLFNGNVVTNGSSVTAYESPSVDYDTGSCTSQVRTCTDGVLSGSYNFNACAVDGPIATDFMCSRDNNTWVPCSGVITLSTRQTPLYVRADNDVERWYQCGNEANVRATFSSVNDAPRSARATFNYLVPITTANQVQDMGFCLDAVNTPDVQKVFKIKLLDFGFNEG